MVKKYWDTTLWGVSTRYTIFVGFHVASFLAIWVGVSWRAIGLGILMYYLRMFGITAGLHRYFSHRTYKTSRAFQFILALLGSLSLQKGILWWAAHHRYHHSNADTEADLHSPKRQGVYWAHMGWFMSRKYCRTKWDRIRDFAKFPELRFLNKFDTLPFILFCLLIYFTMGFQALVWGCFISTVVLFHSTFLINSMAHIFGRRVYKTKDTSKNSLILALITLGEGWHNNHHFYPSAAHQGFRWYEIDITWYILLILEKLGIIWDVRRAPRHVIQGWLGSKFYRLKPLKIKAK